MLLTPVTLLGRLIHNACELDTRVALTAFGSWVEVRPMLKVEVLSWMLEILACTMTSPVG